MSSNFMIKKLFLKISPLNLCKISDREPCWKGISRPAYCANNTSKRFFLAYRSQIDKLYQSIISKLETIFRIFLPLKGVLKRAAGNHFANLLIPLKRILKKVRFIGVTVIPEQRLSGISLFFHITEVRNPQVLPFP